MLENPDLFRPYINIRNGGIAMEHPKRRRPIASKDVHITPEFRRDPDIEKLGRALIAVAIRIAEQKQAEEDKAKEVHHDEKEDSMT